MYRVYNHYVSDLSLVDSDFSCSTCPVLLWVMRIWQNRLSSRAGEWNIRPNPTIRPDVPPCTLAMNYFIVAKCRHTTRIHLLETNLLGSLENELVACLQSQSQSWFFKAIGHEATVSWQRRSVHEVPKGRDTFDLLCLVTLSCHCKIAIAYPNEGIVWLDDLALCITFRLRTLQLQPSNFQVPSLSRQSNAASTISLASCSEISQRELILLLLYVKFLY